MRQKKPLSCSSILQNATAAILKRGRELARLDHTVRRLLPNDLATHCQVVNFRDGTLVITTSSAARATQLRFTVPELQSRLQHQLPMKLETIKIRVRPENVQPARVTRPAQTLSATSANLLAQTAKTLDHPGLKEALYRIATRVRNN